MVNLRSKLTPISVLDLVDKEILDAPAWIEPAVLPKGGLLLFGGYAKIGKSFLLFELARALATGQPVFGNPTLSVPKPAKVLVIEQELGERGAQRRLRKIIAEDRKDSRIEKLLGENMTVLSQQRTLKLNDPMARQGLINACLETGANVLLLDPISKMHTYDENDNSEIERLMGNLEEIRDRCKGQELSIVMSHHFGKPPREDNGIDPFSPYNFRGASKWFDAPDTLVTCVHRKAPLRPDPMWYLDTQWILRQGEPLENEGKMHLSVNEAFDLRVRQDNKSRKIGKLVSGLRG